MSKLKKTLLVSTIVLFICWSSMTMVDFWYSKQAKRPIFSVPIKVTDCSLYRGFGYTITLRYGGIVGRPGEELKGYFSWGWY